MRHKGIRRRRRHRPGAKAPLLVSVFPWTATSASWCPRRPRPALSPIPIPNTLGAARPQPGDWEVIPQGRAPRSAPRTTKLSRTVGAQIPTGFDRRSGGSARHGHLDRPGGTGISSPPSTRSCPPGFTPAEVMRWASQPGGQHQGTGYGRHDVDGAMFHGNLLGTRSPTTSCRKFCQPNVVAAHVMQSYVGGWRSHGASGRRLCHFAAVLVEGGCRQDPPRQGRSGRCRGFDDLIMDAVIGR